MTYWRVRVGDRYVGTVPGVHASAIYGSRTRITIDLWLTAHRNEAAAFMSVAYARAIVTALRRSNTQHAVAVVRVQRAP